MVLGHPRLALWGQLGLYPVVGIIRWKGAGLVGPRQGSELMAAPARRCYVEDPGATLYMGKVTER